VKVIYSPSRNEIKIAESKFYRKKFFREINIFSTVKYKNQYLPKGTVLFTYGKYLENSDWTIIGIF